MDENRSALCFEGTYDARTLPELGYSLLSKAQVRLLAGTAIVSAVLCGASIALKNTTFAFTFILLIIAVFVDARWQVKRICTVNLKRAAETNRIRLDYRCTLRDDGIAYENRESGGKMNIAWKDVKTLVETAHNIYIVTGAQQMIGLDKSGIPAQTKAELYAYAGSKGVRIKVKKR